MNSFCVHTVGENTKHGPNLINLINPTNKTTSIFKPV